MTPSEPAPPPAKEAPKPDEPAKEEPKKSVLNEKGEKGAVPEKYEFKLPDGFNMDEKVAKEASDLFRDIGLDQSSAQRLVDFYTARVQEAVEAPMNLWSQTQEKWIDEVKADPVIGRRLPEVKATVSRAIDGLGDPKLAQEFRQAMDITGAGNNPAFIRTFFKLAQMVTEGSHVRGNGPAEAGQQAPDAKPKSAASALYPGLP